MTVCLIVYYKSAICSSTVLIPSDIEKTKNLRDIKTVAAIIGDDYKVIIKTYLHPDEDNKYHCPSTILPPYEVILFVLKRFLTELSKKN